MIADARTQQGLSLPVTLVMLAVMTLMAIALVRSVDTTNQVINNITFKQSALAAADAGIESAIAWLGNAANDSLLTSDQPGLGYYAANVVPSTTNSYIDFTGTVTPGDTSDDVDWWMPRTASLPVKANLVAGQVNNNDVAYVIHRLCTGPGAPGAATCVTGSSSVAGSGGSKGAGGFLAITATANEVAYRITSRTQGPKGTVGYVQAIVMKPY